MLVEKLEIDVSIILDQILLNVEISYFIVDPIPNIFLIKDESVDEFAILLEFPAWPNEVEKLEKF